MAVYQFAAQSLVSVLSVGDNLTEGIDSTLAAAVNVAVQVEGIDGAVLEPLSMGSETPIALTSSSDGYTPSFKVRSDDPTHSVVRLRVGTALTALIPSQEVLASYARIDSLEAQIQDLSRRITDVASGQVSVVIPQPGSASIPVRIVSSSVDVSTLGLPDPCVLLVYREA